MSQFEAFMKGNRKEKEEKEYAPTRAFVDKDGEPIKWRFKPISSKEFEQLKSDCTKQTVTKKGASARVDAKELNSQLIAACTVFPNLYDAELQESYGVTNPSELLFELVSDPGEYTELTSFIQELCGFDRFSDLVEEAKN